MNSSTFQTSRVLKAAKEFLADQIKRREEMQEKHIKEYMRNKIYIFLGTYLNLRGSD